MNRFWTLLLILLLAIFAGSLYGILHDQLTYTISPEYYTKFKFYQFGFVDVGNEAILPNPRLAVATTGVLATWWMGALIGLVLGLVGLAHSRWQTMLRITLNAFLLTITIAFITGLVGLAYGKFYLVGQPKVSFADWFMPDNIIDLKHYIMVGSMHNFSYLGGLIGLLTGVVYSLFKRVRHLPEATGVVAR